MGCFLGCFGSSKDGKRRKHRNNKVQPRNQQVCAVFKLGFTMMSFYFISLHFVWLLRICQKRKERFKILKLFCLFLKRVK